MSSAPVLLLFGYGPRTGKPIAEKFIHAGYRVAAVGRSLEDGPVVDDFLNIKADLADPTIVPEVYKKTQAYFKQPPNVVVYNAYSRSEASSPTDGPFSIPLVQFEEDLNVNITSLYAAGAAAVHEFELLPPGNLKIFAFIGNKQSHGVIFPSLISNGIGKTAAAYVIGCAATGYPKRGFNFYYVDEREKSGAPVFAAIDGHAHGDFLLQLAANREQGPWEATFVKDQGYTKFPELGGL